MKSTTKLDDHWRGLHGPRPSLWAKIGRLEGVSMVCLGARIKNHKLRGEWAELVFMARVKEMGFGLVRPWGESSRYDIGVEWEGRYMRVQVKSTIYKVGHAYVCNTRPDNNYRRYTVRQIDFLAAYVISENVWYIVPARVAPRLKGNIWPSPHKEGHKYERFHGSLGIAQGPGLA